ncbi:hypothetical protein V2G26_001796 [Clonostachys chloroleuca]
MSPSDKYLGQSFLGEEQLRAMISSSERKGSSTETVREESLDYSLRSPEDKETSVDVAYEELRRSTKRKREDDPDTRASGSPHREGPPPPTVWQEGFRQHGTFRIKWKIRTIIEEHNEIFFWIPRQLLHDVRRRVAAVGWGQDLIIAKRRDHLVNICINFQPGCEGTLSALLNDLERAIEQGEGKDDEEAQGSGGENGIEAYESEVEDDTEACESESVSEDEGVEVEESEYGNGDESEDEIGNGNEAKEN